MMGEGWVGGGPACVDPREWEEGLKVVAGL